MLTSTLVVIVVVFILELLRRRWELFRYFEKRGIPGPKPHFLWGHYHLLQANHTFWLDKWTKEYGDTFGVFWGNKPMLVSIDLDLQQKVLVKEFSNFVNRARLLALEEAHPLFRTMLTMEKDSRWKNLRSVISPSFSSARMKAMTPLIVKGLQDFERNLYKQESKYFDVYPLLKRLTMDNIGRAAFGIDANTQADPNNTSPLVVAALEFIDVIMSEVTDLLTNSFSFTGLNNFLEFLFRYDLITHASTKLCREATKIVKARRHGPKRSDLMQSFLDNNVMSVDVQALEASGQDDDSSFHAYKGKSKSLSNEQVVTNVCLIFAAGYETTSTGIASLLSCLGANPEIQARLRDEIINALGKEGTQMTDIDTLYTKVMGMKYLDQCVQEALRLFPPVTGFTTRTPTEPSEYKGITLEKGLGLLFPTRTVHHDARYWPKPLTYDPDRFAQKPVHPLAYQPFGGGPRNCVGMKMAVMSIKLTLCHILPKMKIVTNEKCTWTCKNVVCQPEKVMIRVESI